MGSFAYDYAKNRLRENSHTVGFSMSTYWFGDPQPQGVILPAGVQPGHTYAVTTTLGKKSCSVRASPGMSITRPDSFAKGGEITPERLTYLGREFVKEAGRWTDHWAFNDGSCGNFTEWIDINTHFPIASDGPLGCGAGASKSWWTNHKIGEPSPETWTDFDFTTCKNSSTEQQTHTVTSMLAARGLSLQLVV